LAKTIVRVRELTKRFNGLTAVDRISFDIYEGEIIGLLGPNGAGKTTTIHMLLDIVTPNSGQILIDGRNLSQYREEILRQINFASSHIAMPYSLTVEENLQIFARLYELPHRQERIEQVIDELDMASLRAKLTRTLSSGQMTRLSLAKAFLTQPKLLLLDEPTASLDPDSADKTRALVRKYQRHFGCTILYTSHNMREMEEMSDRIIFLQRGKVVASGTTQEIISQFGRRDLEDVFLTVARTG
jgi:ABC-2 type transport system ATP-binding protein|tara:strand:+ start:2934 stop:3662 length:729 start_codon:yes stop_codon:yes gene_type:complete